MERTKLLLTIAPMAALIFAVAYLQGYWGYFKLLMFPYLSINEIIGYAAAPLFGFLLFSAAGMFLGILNAHGREHKPNMIRIGFEILLVGIVSGLLIYYDAPHKWLFVPFIVLGLLTMLLLKNQILRERAKASPNTFLIGLVSVFFIFGSFGYGRFQAQTLAKTTKNTVQVTIGETIVNTKLVGKVSNYYFFLNQNGKISQHPESTVKQIIYEESI